jgi:hypothetical protein
VIGPPSLAASPAVAALYPITHPYLLTFTTYSAPRLPTGLADELATLVDQVPAITSAQGATTRGTGPAVSGLPASKSDTTCDLVVHD